jgi:hypothetical protein
MPTKCLGVVSRDSACCQALGRACRSGVPFGGVGGACRNDLLASMVRASQHAAAECRHRAIRRLDLSCSQYALFGRASVDRQCACTHVRELRPHAMPCHRLACCGQAGSERAVLCCAVLCCVVLCCAVLCCAVLCCAVLCCAVLCCAVLSGLRAYHGMLMPSSAEGTVRVAALYVFCS